ncbi:pyridoxamine 5'-phosphate oxidase family protein [Novosphingobium sp. PP1Y]|uniref:pyridoxamine 5'-phosphate oxidase family protein n=1 Tax=Novosphingobium sp. PP1Y TaxID=702113 RepID=UPI0002FE62FE|nr:pyridoxamine 5'-phosphate oxidase family protein [Novosphingobium sp. PP1Y]
MEKQMDREIRKTFWNAFHSSPVVMMRLNETAGHAEPMTAQLDKEAHHAIWFFAKRGNRIARGGKAMGQVATLRHDVFASLSGLLVEETDPAVRTKHWSHATEAWFPNGKDDPNVIMLRFDIDDAEVWTAHIGVKGAFNLLTGRPIDPSQAGDHVLGAV